MEAVVGVLAIRWDKEWKSRLVRGWRMEAVDIVLVCRIRKA